MQEGPDYLVIYEDDFVVRVAKFPVLLKCGNGDTPQILSMAHYGHNYNVIVDGIPQEWIAENFLDDMRRTGGGFVYESQTVTHVDPNRDDEGRRGEDYWLEMSEFFDQTKYA